MNSAQRNTIGVLLLLVFTIITFSIHAKNDIPPRPNPVKFYNNLSTAFPNFLNPSEANSIELKLKSFSDSTSNQIIVVIVDELNGLEPWSYATELGEKWKPGQEKEDNGVVLLIKPTGGQGERKTFIATGKGLEAVIPDFTCLEIVNNELLPNFKRGDFYAGVNDATDVLMSLAVEEFNFSQYSNNKSNGGELPIWAGLLFFLIFISIGFIGKFNRGGGTYYSGSGFSSRSGSFGGSSFGGRSSFGGGSFGGGGAGGSW